MNWPSFTVITKVGCFTSWSGVNENCPSGDCKELPEWLVALLIGSTVTGRGRSRQALRKTA